MNVMVGQIFFNDFWPSPKVLDIYGLSFSCRGSLIPSNPETGLDTALDVNVVMPKLNSNVILTSSKDSSPIFDFSVQFPNANLNIEVSGDIRLDDEFRSLTSEFDISLNLPPGQYASTDLRKDWRSLWIGNSSWQSSNASAEGVLNSVYTEDDREILRMNSQLSVSTHEQNAYRITTEEKSLEHTHERDFNGQLRKLDAKGEGIMMTVSYGDDGKVQGCVSGDPPLLINENNFSEWFYSNVQSLIGEKFKEK